MKHANSIIAAVVAGAIAAGGGYWAGTRSKAITQADASHNLAAQPASASKARKLLYYRNPMGLPDTSPKPKKDPMGMDYIAVYEGEDDDANSTEPAAANQIKISTEKVQKLGVRTEVAQMRALDKVVRANGRIEPDERRLYAISPKFEGYVERLHVNVTGQPVSKGQPLFEVYSPELVSAQREYAIAAQGIESLRNADPQTQASMAQLAQSSLIRLKNWDVSEEQVKALTKSGETKRTLTFRSPVSGIVTEKKALQGMRFMPGEALYQIADLSSVWVVADVFEQDIGAVRQGATANVRINAYPDKTFSGKIAYIYPSLNAETRTAQVRIELANPGLLLKPAMFAQVELPVSGSGKYVTVPTSAVIDSGARQIVLLQRGEGRFEPREVKLGQRSDNYIAVLEGINEGDAVVVAANFLIDAESNLKAAIGNFGAGTDTPAKAAALAVGHKAEGIVDEVDSKAGTASISHGPIASLKWPAMTMEFTLANPGLLATLKPGTNVAFEFVERNQGEWVITKVERKAAGAASSSPADPHAGH